MDLLFLGSGAALSSDASNYQSNMVLVAPSGKKMLIDCGTDIRFSLTAQNLSFQDIQAVYISHVHADHAGGLEWLALNAKFAEQPFKPHLHCQKDVAALLWNHTLSGGLTTLPEDSITLETFFDVHMLDAGDPFEWEGATLTAFKTVHVMAGDTWMPTYGLTIRVDDKTTLITTDTQFHLPSLLGLYQQADYIFHDCEIVDAPTGVHAHFNELSALDVDIKSKMWLYHYNPLPLPDAKAAGFKGFVERGQTFHLNA